MRVIDGYQYKIMIVDDEADVREGIVRHIAWDALGFEIIAEAENGQDALEKAESAEVDVVLTDIKMPFLDGLSMGARLLQTHPAVKLIILTGFNEFEYAKEAIRLRAVEYVLKPVNVAELTEVLSRVKRTLDEGIAEKRNIEALRKSYQNSLPLMRERFLNELLWGTVSAEEAEAQLAQYDLSIGGASNAVVAVFELEQKTKKQPAVAWELVPLSVKQMIEESLEGHCNCAVFVSSSAIIAITTWEDANPVSSLMLIANEICSRIKRVLDLDVTAGIGRVYGSIQGVHDSFVEARNALEYKVVTGAGRAIYIQDMERSHEGALLDNRAEEQLLSIVKFGSREQVRLFMEDLIGKAEGRNAWSRQAYLIGVLNAVFRIVERYELFEQPAIRGRMQKLLHMPDGLVRGEICEALCDICASMREHISAQRMTAAKNLVTEAKRFIDEHYQDRDLSVERLCEHLHVSQSYFSTIFRQETGTSYVQYLTEVRMGRALTLLQETDDKTYIIANKVGYEELNYFSYVFKKRFGVSPSKFRK